jgi:N-acylneuraminate cytidylyltransferase
VVAGSVLAIVQARGGSKSIPGKNLRPLSGHPLIAYSIAAGLASRLITRVIVSTDDEGIAAVARNYGAEAPFLRPAEFARDDTPDFPLFQHALAWLREHEGYEPEVVVQLRPTSPLRPVGLLDGAIETLVGNPVADSVRSVTRPNQNPYKMWASEPAGWLQPLLPRDGRHEPYNMPRQALPEVFWQTGHVDVVRSSTIVKGSLTGERILPFNVERKYAVDIDTLADWHLAEWLLSHEQLRVVVPSIRPEEKSPSIGRRPLPLRPALVALDFDGVLTDDRVWVVEDGKEAVVCSRSDGFGLDAVRRAGIEVVVISRESNPVVSARCRKLGIDCRQSVLDKGTVLRTLARERGISLEDVVYVGNDVTDLECFTAAGCGVAVADAHPDVLSRADIVLTRPGGRGAVRELCDLILRRHVDREDA